MYKKTMRVSACVVVFLFIPVTLFNMWSLLIRFSILYYRHKNRHNYYLRVILTLFIWFIGLEQPFLKISNRWPLKVQFRFIFWKITFQYIFIQVHRKWKKMKIKLAIQAGKKTVCSFLEMVPWQRILYVSIPKCKLWYGWLWMFQQACCCWWCPNRNVG